MMSWKTHIKISIIIFSVFLFTISCEDNEVEKDVYVAEVGDSKLTERELNSLLVNNNGSTKYKREFIKNWVETEVLNQVASEKKLLNDGIYNEILNQSAKELAATISISEYLKSKPLNFSEKELLTYFNKTKKDYQSNTDAFVVNIISFNDEAKAISFRNKGIVDGWKSAIALFMNDSSVIEITNNGVYKDYHIQSKMLSRILKEQYLNEISPVVKTELNNFVVVQQIDKINKNTVPKFKYIKDKVKERYLILKQRELVKNYIDSLITEKNVKIY